MFYISDIFTEKPNTTTTILQKEVYNTIGKIKYFISACRKQMK